MAKQFYVIDGSGYIFRAYYAIRELSNSAGLPTNAVYGFTQMLLKIIRDKKPDYLAIAFDESGPTFRHESYKDYKADRAPMPDPLSQQIPYIHKMVTAFQIPLLKNSGLEADDLIGALAKKGEAAGLEVVIVTGDKDMYQLITPKVTVYDSMKDKLHTEATIKERFGIAPNQIVEMMGLMGDKVDNIPGVPGIGEKTAVSLIKTFGSIDNLLEHLNEVKKPKLRQSLEKEQDNARLSRELATIQVDCPVEFDLKKLETQSPDLAQIIPLCKELEFSSLLNAFVPLEALESEDDYRVLDEAGLADLGQTIQAEGAFAFAFLTDQAGAMSEKALGLAISTTPGTGHYLPLPVSGKIPKAFGALFASKSIVKIGYDLKDARMLLHRIDIALEGKNFDAHLAAYLLNPGRRDQSLESVALETLQAHLPPLNRKDDAPVAEKAIRLGGDTPAGTLCRHAEALCRLGKALGDALAAQSLTTLFEKVEMPLVAVLSDIEETGVRIDLKQLAAMSQELEKKLAALEKTIYTLAKGEFNINSPKQLAEILFERLELTPIKKTKTGYSTNEEVLKQLAVEHPLPAEILNSRQLTKLKSTYIDALPKLVNPKTGRVHTQLNQTVAATGRLSSKNPNLQNIPIRGDLGRRIRETFIAAPGNVLLSADYNQVELRILAHLSDDPKLIESFRIGEDIHTRTAIEIFGLDKDDITAEMRRAAKAVNFGILYGMSAFGLSNNIGVSLQESKRYIDLYFENYRGVKAYIDRSLKDATEKGYVTTLFNRRRHIPELASGNSFTRGVGERLAINTPVQGSAADIIKLAMISIWQWMQDQNLESRMTLQIHDELLFDVPEKEVDLMKKEVAERMENVISLKVPITVDVGVGLNWSEAH
ncbi:MAG: DNA polymerase I [Nitrospiria bacterium]